MIEPMTYGELYQTALNAICNNCANVKDGGSGIPSSMKAGYVSYLEIGTSPSGEAGTRSRIRISLIGNSVRVVAPSFVDYCLGNYLDTIGTFEGIITPNGMITYMDALVRFISRNVKFYYSYVPRAFNGTPQDAIKEYCPVFQPDPKTGKYWGVGVTKSEVDPPIIKHNYPCIAVSVAQVLKDLFNETLTPTRCVSVKYSYVFEKY